jgi:hypothetical protein
MTDSDVCPDCGHDHETLECPNCPEGYCEPAGLTGQGWIHPDTPPHITRQARESLALYDQYLNDRADLALPVIAGLLAQSVADLLGQRREPG